MRHDLARRAAAEFLGTGFLAAAVIGSGIMAERLAGGSAATLLFRRLARNLPATAKDVIAPHRPQQ